jgi:hypothetical protein
VDGFGSGGEERRRKLWEGGWAVGGGAAVVLAEGAEALGSRHGVAFDCINPRIM